jgi:hypothetical protein
LLYKDVSELKDVVLKQYLDSVEDGVSVVVEAEFSRDRVVGQIAAKRGQTMDRVNV